MTTPHRQDDGLPFKCNCPHETRAGCSEPKCPHYVKPRATPASRDGAEGMANVRSTIFNILNEEITQPRPEYLPAHFNNAVVRLTALYTTPPKPAHDALREAVKAIEAKIAQLEHYRDNDCQLEYARTIADGRILQARQDVLFIDRAMKQAALSPAPVPPADGVPHRIDHDGFEGTVIGHYVTREGKRGVVLQQIGTKVVHVYGEKWLAPLPAGVAEAKNDE